jgi:hypothetical protein
MRLEEIPGRGDRFTEGARDLLVPADWCGEGDRHPAPRAGERAGGELGDPRAGTDLDLSGRRPEAFVPFGVGAGDRIEDTHVLIIALSSSRPTALDPYRCKFRGADGGGLR